MDFMHISSFIWGHNESRANHIYSRRISSESASWNDSGQKFYMGITVHKNVLSWGADLK